MPKCPRISVPAGSDVAIVYVTGDPRNQEPAHVRIVFPGGDVELVRARDGEDADYWVHVRIEDADSESVRLGESPAHRITDARLDIRDKPASKCDAGDFANPKLYHLAVRVTRAGG